MIIDEEDNVRADMMPLEIVWRNPLRKVRAKLKLREAKQPLLRMGRTSQKDSRPSRDLGRQAQLSGMNTTDRQLTYIFSQSYFASNIRLA